MICPHCSADLRRKERYWNMCSRCRGTFALELKENSLHLHDLRVRRLPAMLADPLQPGAPPLRYTPDQLRLAVVRPSLEQLRVRARWLTRWLPPSPHPPADPQQRRADS